MASLLSLPSRDHSKTAFFVLVALAILLVIYVDERFLIDPADPEWKHIATVRFPLLIHGLLGATALLIGPFQFSDRLRAARPRVHRRLGRTYVVAVFISAPIASTIGFILEGPVTHYEQIAQGGLWWLCTMIGLICVLRRNFLLHKAWMMRSYGFCLVFVASRVPDAIPGFHWTDAMLSTTLWWMIAGALMLPDVILTTRALLRRRPAAA